MTTQDTIDWLCRKIIIHSIIYYDYNENIISDTDYDKCCKQLYSLIQDNQNLIQNCYYYTILKDYSPATGFDLKYRLEDKHRKYLEHLASVILWQYKRELGGNDGRKN